MSNTVVDGETPDKAAFKTARLQIIVIVLAIAAVTAIMVFGIHRDPDPAYVDAVTGVMPAPASTTSSAK